MKSMQMHEFVWATQFHTCPVCGKPFILKRVENDLTYRRPFTDIGCQELFESYDGGISWPHHYGATIFDDGDYIIFRRLLFNKKVYTVRSSCIKRNYLTVFFSQNARMDKIVGQTYHRIQEPHLISKIKSLPHYYD